MQKLTTTVCFCRTRKAECWAAQVRNGSKLLSEKENPSKFNICNEDSFIRRLDFLDELSEEKCIFLWKPDLMGKKGGHFAEFVRKEKLTTALNAVCYLSAGSPNLCHV